MNRLGSILFFILIIIVSCTNDTTSVTDEDITWEKVDSPIIINDCFVVPEGSTLTIEPGVIVKFKSSENIEQCDDFYYDNLNVGMIHIKGRLIAEGTEQDSILFTRDGNSGKWGIIWFQTIDSLSIMKNCLIEHTNPISTAGTCFNVLGGISFYSSNVFISNCTIQNNHWGLYCFSYPSPLIVNNVISNNESDGIICSSNSSPQIINNLFINNGCGIDCEISSDAVIINNTIVNNHRGICVSSSNPLVKNTIIWGNDYCFTVTSGSISLSNSLIQYSDLPSYIQDLGFNILNSDPLFMNPDQDDFQLLQESPCINSGDSNVQNLPEFDLMGNPRISGIAIDIGAYEFQE